MYGPPPCRKRKIKATSECASQRLDLVMIERPVPGKESPNRLRDISLLAGGVGGVCCGLRQLSAKSRGFLRLIQSFVFGRDILSRGTRQSRGWAARPDQDFVTRQSLGVRFLGKMLTMLSLMPNNVRSSCGDN